MAFILLPALAASLAAQEKSKWRRVYTYDDAVIEMEEIKLSFGNFGRVRFRTVFDRPESPGGNGVKFKSQVEDVELMCNERQYRITETVLLDDRGRVVRSSRAGPSAAWKTVRAGGMMEKLFVPACRMILEKRL